MTELPSFHRRNVHHVIKQHALATQLSMFYFILLHIIILKMYYQYVALCQIAEVRNGDVTY